MTDRVKNFISEWRYAVGACVVVILFAVWVFGRPAPIGPTMTVNRADFVKKVSVTGTVTAAHDVALGFATSGRISHTYTTVGQRVYEGQILAEIENGDLAAIVQQKQAKLDSLIAGTRPEEIAVAESSVESATAALIVSMQSAYSSSDDAVRNRVDQFITNSRTSPILNFAVTNFVTKYKVESERLDLENIFTLWRNILNGSTKSDVANQALAILEYLAKVSMFLSDANTALNEAVPDASTSVSTIASYASSIATARANVNAALTSVTNYLTTLDSAERNLVLKQAGSTSDDIKAAEADVRSAKADLSKTRVVAPFAGVITRMDANAGEIASPSVSKISLQSDGLFEIETFIPEVSIANVHVNDLSTTTLNAYGSGVTFDAKVVAVDSAETVKDGVPTYKTTLIFIAKDSRIRSGMTANVDIQTGVLLNAVILPSGAVGVSIGESYVTVVVNGKAINKRVQVGSTPSLGQVEVISGLESGDTVVITPLEAAK